MKSLLNSKNAEGGNYIAVVIFLFVLGFTSILGYYILVESIAVFDSAGFYSTAEAQQAGNGFLNAISIIDYLAILIVIVLVIATLITSYRIATRTVAFVYTFFMSAFYGFISYFFNYLFAEFVSQSILTGTLLIFPRLIFICKNFHWIILILIIVGSYGLYAKEEKGQFLA